VTGVRAGNFVLIFLWFLLLFVLAATVVVSYILLGMSGHLHSFLGVVAFLWLLIAVVLTICSAYVITEWKKSTDDTKMDLITVLAAGHLLAVIVFVILVLGR
jgi:hypothetical protein